MMSTNEINFLYKLLLTNRQILSRKAFVNNSSANEKWSKAEVLKIIQSGGFLGRLLRPLKKVGLPLMKNVPAPLAKSVLVPLGLTGAASAADARKKTSGTYGWRTTTLILSNEEMKEIMEKDKSLEDPGLLIKVVLRQLKINKEVDFLEWY